MVDPKKPLNGAKDFFHKIDSLLLDDITSSVRFAYRSNLPTGFLSRFFIAKAEKKFSRDRYCAAERNYRTALAIQLAAARACDVGTLLMLIRKGRPAFHQFEKQLDLSRLNIKNKIKLLYVVYRYALYFSSFETAADLRKHLIETCVRFLLSDASSTPCPLRLFSIVAAFGELPIEVLTRALEKERKARKRKDKRDVDDAFGMVESLFSCLLDRKYIDPENALNGSAVVIGPNYKADSEAGIVETAEYVIRLNQDPDSSVSVSSYRGGCDIVYINTEFADLKLQDPKAFDCYKGLILLRDRDKRQAHLLAGRVKNVTFGFYEMPNALLLNGNANMAVSVAIDLIRKGHSVKLLGIDFFTKTERYSNPHYSAHKGDNKLNMLMRNHDAISNFCFMKALWKEGRVESLGQIRVLEQLTAKDYAVLMQQGFGMLDLGKA